MNTADQHAAALSIVHAESGRTLSKADFDLCMRIAKRALAGTSGGQLPDEDLTEIYQDANHYSLTQFLSHYGDKLSRPVAEVQAVIASDATEHEKPYVTLYIDPLFVEVVRQGKMKRIHDTVYQTPQGDATMAVKVVCEKQSNSQELSDIIARARCGCDRGTTQNCCASGCMINEGAAIDAGKESLPDTDRTEALLNEIDSLRNMVAAAQADARNAWGRHAMAVRIGNDAMNTLASIRQSQTFPFPLHDFGPRGVGGPKDLYSAAKNIGALPSDDCEHSALQAGDKCPVCSGRDMHYMGCYYIETGETPDDKLSGIYDARYALDQARGISEREAHAAAIEEVRKAVIESINKNA
jgi:hypothetical protein